MKFLQLSLIFLNIINIIYCNFIVDENTNIIVIADVHGDIKRFKNILINSNVIDKKDAFILPSNFIVIQLGDQIDPKSDDLDDLKREHFEVIRYTHYLEKEASKTNSRFISFIGNHELMNIEKIKDDSELSHIISHRPIIKRIGNNIYCHGIFKRYHKSILNYFHKTLEDVNFIWYKYVKNIYLNNAEIVILNKLILDVENSILFAKKGDSKYDSKQLMRELDIDNIIIGHIKVEHIIIKNNIWYTNLYLKDAFDNKVYNNLNIHNNTIYIIPLKNSLYI